MKQDHILTPKGVYREEPPMPALATQAADVPSALMATPLQKRAKVVLDAAGTDNRLTLILGILVAIGLGFAVPMILECLLVVSEVLSLLSETKEVRWPVILCIALNLAAALGFTLPLVTALFRMAVLMTEAHRKEQQGETVQNVSFSEILYPFSSRSAYLRTQLVAWRWLLGMLCLLGIPVAVIAAAVWWIPLLCEGLPSVVGFLLWAFNIIVALGLLTLTVFCLCRFAGLGYLIFRHPEISVKELRCRFKTYHRPVGLPFHLAVGHTGWTLLSLVAVCVPFVLHTIPLMLLTGASYGRYLEESNAATEDQLLSEPDPAEEKMPPLDGDPAQE